LSSANQNEDGRDTHVIFLSTIFLSNLIAGCPYDGQSVHGSFGYPYVLPEIRTMQRLRETTILRQDVVAANGTFLTGSGISSSTRQGTSGLNPLAQGDHVLDPQTRINNIRAARNCPDISDLTCGK
jgi:hypothetical protein